MIFIKSVWEKTSKIKNFSKLDGDKETDILIIGGGMSGILCAYFLEQQGADYMLVESTEIGMGITRNTTAKITLGHSLIYDNLIKHFGVDSAKQYLDANKMALDMYYNLCKNIDCDFEEKSALTYSINNRDIIENEILALQRLGYPSGFVDKVPLPFEIDGAIELKNQAQFNPLKFISKISENLNIYENTFVYQINENTAFTPYGKIKAKKIIIATHFPFINSHGSYFLKMYQHRSYVIAIENNSGAYQGNHLKTSSKPYQRKNPLNSNSMEVDGMYVDQAQNGMSFRNYKDLLLIGGGDHRTGKKGGGYGELRDFIKANYPNAKEKYFWATQDCMTLDGIPYIGEYSKSTQNLFVATGFNKWGMTSSMVSAKILSDLVLEKENSFSEVFSPSRGILKPQLFVNLGETLFNFLTPTIKRCSHLGCALKWNKYEHSWDCPCHGSRFDETGKLIDNPARRDINV